MNMKQKFMVLLSASVLTGPLYAEQTVVTLKEAISIALQNNNQLKVSQTAVQIADAQYDQAMSAHYPTLDASVSVMRIDEAPTFEMRGSTIIDNTQTIALYNSLSGAAAGDGNANTAGAYAFLAANTPAESTLPINMDVQMMGRDTAIAKLDMTLPLYTGGKISAITKQASIGKLIAQEGKIKSENQIIFDVKRYYYGVVLTKKLEQLSKDTLERMSFISDLTSQLYKGGSMNVKKTDYLRSKLSVNLIESLHERLVAKEVLAKSALLNAMGVSWKHEVDVSENDFATPKMNKQMQTLVEEAYQYNPDFKTLKLAIDVHEAKMDEAQSEYLPSIALIGSVQRMYNDYDYGLVNVTNENSWTIGVGLQWSIFNGMRTSSKVEQSRLEKLKLQQQEVLLEEGLALQVKKVFLDMDSSYKQYNILVEAADTAEQNRDLNTRAYQEDMVQTKDVIEAQLFEAYTKGDFYRSQHDHALSLAEADYVIGAAIDNAMEQ